MTPELEPAAKQIAMHAYMHVHSHDVTVVRCANAELRKLVKTAYNKICNKCESFCLEVLNDQTAFVVIKRN